MSNAWQKLFRQLFGGAEADTAAPAPNASNHRTPREWGYRVAINGFVLHDVDHFYSGLNTLGDTAYRVVLRPERTMERRAASVSQGRPLEAVFIVTHSHSTRLYQVVSEASYVNDIGEGIPHYSNTLEYEQVDAIAQNALGASWDQNQRDKWGSAVAAIKASFEDIPLVWEMPMEGAEEDVGGITTAFGAVTMAVRHPEATTLSFLVESEDVTRFPGGRAVAHVHEHGPSTFTVTLVREGMPNQTRTVPGLRIVRRDGTPVTGIYLAWEAVERRMEAMTRTRERSDALNAYIRMETEQLRAGMTGTSVRYRGPRMEAHPTTHPTPFGDPYAPPTNRRELRGDRIVGSLGMDQEIARIQIDALARETQEFVRSLAESGPRAEGRKAAPAKPDPVEPQRDEGISTGRRRIRVRRSAQSDPEQE